VACKILKIIARNLNLRLWNQFQFVCVCLKENPNDYRKWTNEKVRTHDCRGPHLLRSEKGADRRLSGPEWRYDILEQPLEVKKRIGYLPETPPVYLEMRIAEYLSFVGQLKGLSGSELRSRVDYACERCAVADVRNKIIGKLSKGYRQRVGLAQAIIHNPDVLILDEPTAGLDPKQINETRDLIKSLAGDHTIILSTHILPEVSQTCEQVIIINKGKIVATDSVSNLQQRARSGESVIVEVAGRNGTLDSATVQRKLEQITGVSRVIPKADGQKRVIFEVEATKDLGVRGNVARAVVESGWDLNELRPAALSLEEIFLQLTGSEAPAEMEPVAAGETK
jgi:ABC-2 type transport system ATP-binding protein